MLYGPRRIPTRSLREKDTSGDGGVKLGSEEEHSVSSTLTIRSTRRSIQSPSSLPNASTSKFNMVLATAAAARPGKSSFCSSRLEAGKGPFVLCRYLCHHLLEIRRHI